MKKKRKFGRKLLSFLLMLAMVIGMMSGMSLTAYADNTETLLTTITATGESTYSESTAGIVTVALENASGSTEWFWSNVGSVTVTANEGYTITKCIFHYSTYHSFEDTGAPYQLTYNSGTCVEDASMNHVSSIEVYGYAPESTLLTTITPTGTNACSQNPAGVVTVTLTGNEGVRYNPEYPDMGWYFTNIDQSNYGAGTATVEATEGYTITKCVFKQTSSDKSLEDDQAPFVLSISEAGSHSYGNAKATVDTSTGTKQADMKGFLLLRCMAMSPPPSLP